MFARECRLGASFQLSFAAVAALVAVYEARAARYARDADAGGAIADMPAQKTGWFGRRRHNHGGLRGPLFATFCATSATASFMAYDFHEMNPYVLIGNPLTLTIIEVFAVPGAIIGTILYPLGLDGYVWHWVGLGISIIMAAARFIGSLPGSTIHLPSFAPWSLVFLSLAVLSAVIWRTLLLRLTAIPFVALGLTGAIAGPSFDIAVAPLGDAVAVRGADGKLSVIGQRPSAFAAEQWLRADADGRPAKGAIRKEACDKTGCVARLPDGRAVALVLDPSAFAEDCLRAAVLVTPLYAPTGCAAGLVIDRETQRGSGAVALKVEPDGRLSMRTARAADEHRPWSPAPKPLWRYRPPGQGDEVSSAE